MASGDNLPLDGHSNSQLQSLELEDSGDSTALLGFPPRAKRRAGWLRTFVLGGKYGNKDPLPQSSLPRDIRGMSPMDGQKAEHSDYGDGWKKLWSTGSFGNFKKNQQGFLALKSDDGGYQ